ncbi:MAG: hypothetical protein PH343_00835 [Nitrospira sp.]|nr:hypothetical protein [Nitrospira sp.]
MKDIEQILKKIQDERFIHNISELTYDRLFALWHLSPSVEKQLSEILSKVIIGLFILRYMEHLNEEVVKDSGLTSRLTSNDLSDKGKIASITKDLSNSKRFKAILEKEILPHLKDIIENSKANNLTDLVKLAHTGDYFSSALEDMRDAGDFEYQLWLEAIPEYYGNDIIHMALKKTAAGIKEKKKRLLLLDKWVTNMHQHTSTMDAEFTDGNTVSLKPWINERRRYPFGFNIYVKENSRTAKVN